MEHRWSDRVFSSLDVLLLNNNDPVIACKVSNINMYGMFVKTGPVKYPKHSVLDVEFLTNRIKDQKIKRLHVYVVHQLDEGMGLAFHDESPGTFDFIRKLIKGATRTDPVSKPLKSNEPLIGKLLPVNIAEVE